jgi:hypothetical protein
MNALVSLHYTLCTRVEPKMPRRQLMATDYEVKLPRIRLYDLRCDGVGALSRQPAARQPPNDSSPAQHGSRGFALLPLESESKSNPHCARWSDVGRGKEAGARRGGYRLVSIVVENVVNVEEGCRQKPLLYLELSFGSHVQQDLCRSPLRAEGFGKNASIDTKSWFQTRGCDYTSRAEVSSKGYT